METRGISARTKGIVELRVAPPATFDSKCPDHVISTLAQARLDAQFTVEELADAARAVP